MLLRGFNNGLYYQFKLHLLNDMTKGTDNFLKTMVETIRILADYIPPPRLQHVRNPDGEGLAFIQGEGGTSRGPKSKGEVECWHCGGPHFKNKRPKLKLLDMGIQNLNIDYCSEEHNLFLADDGYGLVQKQAKGVQGILSPYHEYIDTCESYSSTPYPELISNLKEASAWAHRPQQCRIVRDRLEWSARSSQTRVAKHGRGGNNHPTEAAREAVPSGI